MICSCLFGYSSLYRNVYAKLFMPHSKALENVMHPTHHPLLSDTFSESTRKKQMVSKIQFHELGLAWRKFTHRVTSKVEEVHPQSALVGRVSFKDTVLESEARTSCSKMFFSSRSLEKLDLRLLGGVTSSGEGRQREMAVTPEYEDPPLFSVHRLKTIGISALLWMSRQGDKSLIPNVSSKIYILKK